MINLDFITPEQFTDEVNKLLNSEGLLSSLVLAGRNVVMILGEVRCSGCFFVHEISA